MADNPSLNYFTCTLGEARELRPHTPPGFQTVNTLIELQAERHPNQPAVAFPVLLKTDRDSNYEIFTFKDLHEGSLKSAESFVPHAVHPESVALLCHSSMDFLFAWLGLIRAGFSVLLIAPQCDPSAIVSLCSSCKVSRLFHDDAHSSLAAAAAAAAEPGSSLLPVALPGEKKQTGMSQLIRSKDNGARVKKWPEVSSDSVAYIHHSSGTSSGHPKPIPQTHHGAVSVLPCLQGKDAATFTTTPLYHGGISDCFRAWSSGALIWLFPGADAPITTDTILSCLSVAKSAVEKARTPAVKYFSGVPYVLQMLSATSAGLRALQAMDIVGVGGAALPDNIGDRLVEENVHLVSRYGSAECGFLLSSQRPHGTDRAWQYLRLPEGSRLLSFEGEGGDSNLSELIVSSGWPHMAKRNRDDGCFATCDLFEPHPKIKGAWKYHSRRDSQITLLTGKKFDPEPLEETIKASSSLIADVFIFGRDKQMPGALVFLKEPAGSLSQVVSQEIWKTFETVNSKSPSHARISRNMIQVLSSTLPPLERSSKGTLLRRQAERLYASTIDAMYQPNNSVSDYNASGQSKMPPSSQAVESTIRKIIVEVMGQDFDLTDDSGFFHRGVDSTKATQIRSSLQQAFAHDSLPWNVVYDCENLRGLVRYFTEPREENFSGSLHNSIREMVSLVEKYSRFDIPPSVNRGIAEARSGSSRTVILTGATGGLGAHILHRLRDDPAVSRIICLVRAADDTTARARVSSSMAQRRLRRLSDATPDDKIRCMPVELGDRELGLSTDTRKELKETVTHIIHAAWAVNFSLPLTSFVTEHISGLRSLINLAISCRHFEQFVFCSSTASVMGQAQEAGDNPIPETLYLLPPPESSLGYSKSKWVAETICSKAAATPLLTGRVKVLRVGQLTGDTTHGVWNRSEAWPLMLSAARQLGCLPRLDEKLSWLPVDVAAQAVIDISQLQHPTDTQTPCTVYHLVNNDQTTTWIDFLRWISRQGGGDLSLVEPIAWLDKLETLDQHPAKSLLGFWRASFGTLVHRETLVVFATRNAESASRCMRRVGPVDDILAGKIWHWLQEEDGSSDIS